MRGLIVFTLSFISVFLTFYVLKAGEGIIVPFMIALVIAYLIISLAEGIERVRMFGKKMPRTFSFLVAICLIAGAIYFTISVLSSNVTSLMLSAPIYQTKLKHLTLWFFDTIDKPVPDISKVLQDYDFMSLLTKLIFVLKDIASGAGIIAIYVLFILVEYHFFNRKMAALFQSKDSRESSSKILKKIGSQIQSYLRIKSLVSVVTAICAYAVLKGVGVDFSEFWAFLIFFLNFIPTIGSIISTILPCILTLLQFETWVPFAIVTAGLTSIHLLIGNYIEPRIMCGQFNLSGLAIILSLMIASTIWGVVGMILSVPLLMITSIILSNFPETKPIAIILSQTGKVDD